MKKRRLKHALKRAMSRQRHVIIERRLKGTDGVAGYVIAVGKSWLLLATTMEGGYLDGFTALRTKDVYRVRKDKHFAARLLKAIGQDVPSGVAGEIDLSGPGTIIRDAAARETLVSVFRERTHPDACRIGTPIEWEGDYVWLLEIDPQARWDNCLDRHRLKKLTRIDFGGAYQTGLLAVGGPVPPPSVRERLTS